MSRPVLYTDSSNFDSFSDIIDVRSPQEFATDHIPGAVNYYVLDNAQRAEVGTLYKQVNPFTARKSGAALMSANISHWLGRALKDKPSDYRPLVYCWRGGQRSGGFATVLSAIGWETTVITGGYKHYRHLVLQQLETLPKALHFVVLSGLTGTAKTHLLKLLHAAGEQVLDLEGMAEHRGSLLGWKPDQAQPTQKMFESLLADQLKRFSKNRPVWVESESNKIGNIHCPAEFWKQMQKSPRIEITAPTEARVNYLLDDYAFLQNHRDDVLRRLSYLKSQHGKETIHQWSGLFNSGKLAQLIENLLTQHYDPSYTISTGRYQDSIFASMHFNTLSKTSLQEKIPSLIQTATNAIVDRHSKSSLVKN